MTKKKVSKAIVDDDLLLDQKKQTLHMDVMLMDGQRLLITVCEPLKLTLKANKERESLSVLGRALQWQSEILRNRGFVPTRVHPDPQSAFRSMASQFENVVIDVGGAGNYVPKVDAKIQRIKEMYQSIKSGLAWNLPNIMVKDLIAYCVSRINIQRTTAINQSVAPRVLFTGMRVDYRKELCLHFGEYCEVYDVTDNTSKSQSVPCIALYPCNNAVGSWLLMNLVTKKLIQRLQLGQDAIL